MKTDTAAADWPLDMSLEAYQRAVPLNQESVYEYFFEANKDSIKVQNREVAVPKLKVILESIFRISARRGFHAMSLRDLCQDTGISMGGMYNYISSKDALARMVTEFVGVTIVELNNPLLDAAPDLHARMEIQLRAQIYMAELFRPWYFFMFMETKNQPPEQRQRSIEVESNVLKALNDLIGRGIEAGIYDKVNSRLTAAALQSVVEDWYLKTWYFKGSGLTATQYGDFAVESAHRLLGFSKGT